MSTVSPQHSETVPMGLGPRDIFLLLLTQLMWGGGIVITKMAVEDMPPLLFLAVRFIITAALLAPLLRWHKGQMGLIVLIAVFNLFLASTLTTVGLAMSEEVAPVAIAIQLSVPFSTLLSVLVLQERLGPWRLSALVVAFGGVLVIGFDPSVFNYLSALLVVIAGALSTAIGAILIRRVRGIKVYEVQAWLALLTFPPLFLLSALFEGSPVDEILNITWITAFGVVWMTIGSGLIGQAVYYWVMQRHEVGLTAPFMLLAPILGALGGALFLGDVLTWRMILGGVLTLGGVLIITLREGRKATTP